MTLRFDRNEFARLFGRRLHACRIAANLSQAELAEKTGYHVQTVSNLERGLVLPSLTGAFVFAEALDVNAKTLLFGE